MKRLTLALTVFLAVGSVASASLSQRKESNRLDHDPIPHARMARNARSPVSVQAQETSQTASQTEYIMTQETEVLLNGKPCKYNDVPPNASIERMEVGIDKKTVLRVYFRKRK